MSEGLMSEEYADAMFGGDVQSVLDYLNSEAVVDVSGGADLSAANAMVYGENAMQGAGAGTEHRLGGAKKKRKASKKRSGKKKASKKRSGKKRGGANDNNNNNNWNNNDNNMNGGAKRKSKKSKKRSTKKRSTKKSGGANNGNNGNGNNGNNKKKMDELVEELVKLIEAHCAEHEVGNRDALKRKVHEHLEKHMKKGNNMPNKRQANEAVMNVVVEEEGENNMEGGAKKRRAKRKGIVERVMNKLFGRKKRSSKRRSRKASGKKASGKKRSGKKRSAKKSSGKRRSSKKRVMKKAPARRRRA